MRMRSYFLERRAAIVASLILLAGCGASTTPITFDETTATGAESSTTFGIGSLPSDGSTGAATDGSTTVPLPNGQWVDITGNLVGVSSECGTTTLVTSRNDRDGLIAGIARQGLFGDENSSEQWTPLGQDPGSATITNRPSSIVFDPADPRRFWESGVYNDGGVFETRDGGATFTALGNVEHSDLVSVDFSDPKRQTLLSGTHEQPVVYRSSDGGSTWQDISAGLPPNIGSASFPQVVDSTTYLLGTKAGSAAGVFRTTDSGATWNQVHSGAVSGPPLLAKSDGQVYWLLDNGGLITSADGGATWTDIASYGPAGGNSGNLLELPDGRLATLGTTNIVVSADHGAQWRTVGASLPFRPAGVAYSPFHQTFFIWRSDCDNSTAASPVAAGSIMRLDGWVDAAP
jgi:photosystem II stability/assembly factor-like uncharacterized protein